MLSHTRGVLAALIVLGCAASLAQAGDKDDIKESIKSLAKAMHDGDGDAAKRYVDDNENSQKLIETLVKVRHASEKLQDAAVAKFGDEGKSLGANRMAGNAPNFEKDLDDAQITVNGDTATVQPKNGDSEHPTTFKKIKGTWKLDLQSMPNAARMAQSSTMMGKMAEAMTEVAGEIKDGKYSSVQEARQGLFQKIAASVRGGAAGGPPPQR